MEKDTRVGKVREELIRKKTPVWRLSQSLNMTRRQVVGAMRSIETTYEAIVPQEHIIKFPEAPTAHFENRELQRLVDPYIDMGMTAIEVQLAIFFETGLKLSKNQSRDAVNKARSRGNARPLLPQEKEDSSLNSHISTSEIQDRVLLWLDSARVARILDREEDLTDRVRWSKWMEFCIEKGYVTLHGIRSRILASDRVAASKKTNTLS